MIVKQRNRSEKTTTTQIIEKINLKKQNKTKNKLNNQIECWNCDCKAFLFYFVPKKKREKKHYHYGIPMEPKKS